jgi:hypothetical protein
MNSFELKPGQVGVETNSCFGLEEEKALTS